jgi:hypothetical protein
MTCMYIRLHKFVRRVHVCSDFNYRRIASKSQPYSLYGTIRKQQQQQPYDDSNSLLFLIPIIIVAFASATADANLFSYIHWYRQQNVV